MTIDENEAVKAGKTPDAGGARSQSVSALRDTERHRRACRVTWITFSNESFATVLSLS
jgi:hypothetical protein